MTASLPLLTDQDPGYRALWRGDWIDRQTFASHIGRVMQGLPSTGHVLNLCQDRYLFTVLFAAIIGRGQCNLLPANRTDHEIAAVAGRYPGSVDLVDEQVLALLNGDSDRLPSIPSIPIDQPAAIVFTSGSTGQSQPNIKHWGSLVVGARLALERFGLTSAATVVATVPPQHMYGLETSVMVPLIGGLAIHSGRPFYPDDLCRALAAVEAPRVLITTPAHLRVCAEAGLEWPSLYRLISATAPLPDGLAWRSEQVFSVPVMEIFGFSEAGSIASRRTLDGPAWWLYDGVRLDSEPSQVSGGHLDQPVRFGDRFESLDEQHFIWQGREQDMVIIAGKRAALGDLNHKLNEIDGVRDGVFIAPDPDGTTERLAALVVAPDLTERQILDALKALIDPVFLPRPLYRVERLPRTETSKLPRQALLALLARLRQRL